MIRLCPLSKLCAICVCLNNYVAQHFQNYSVLNRTHFKSTAPVDGASSRWQCTCIKLSVCSATVPSFHCLFVSLYQLVTVCVARYRMQDGSQQPWLTIRVIPAGAMSMTVFQLHPDMLYQFMVLSRVHSGDGLFSEIVTLKTKGEIRK